MTGHIDSLKHTPKQVDGIAPCFSPNLALQNWCEAGWIYGRHFTYPFPEIQNPELKDIARKSEMFTTHVVRKESTVTKQRFSSRQHKGRPQIWATLDS